MPYVRVASAIVVVTTFAWEPEVFAAEPEIVEVVVDGERADPATETLDRETVRRMPGALGDPFRAIEALPGVTPIISGLPFFYVRGAPPGNVGYFLDGIRVPYLFHVLGGPSVIHPGLVGDVDLHKAAYPAQYGRFAGGIVSATTLPPTESWRAEGTLRLTDGGALTEARFADGRASALIAGRYAFAGLIAGPIARAADPSGPDLTLEYRDFQARATLDVTPRDRLSVLAFGAYDYLSTTDKGIEKVEFATEFYRVDTRYDASLPDGGMLRAAVTTGVDDSILNDGRRARDVIVGSRVFVRKPVGKRTAIDLGFDMQHDAYNVDTPPYSDPDDIVNQGYNRLFQSRPDTAVGTWLGMRYQFETLEIEPAVRVDGYLSNGQTAVGIEPRLSATVRLTDFLRVMHAVGVAHQPPAYLAPVPGVAPVGLDEGLQTALQASASIQVALPWRTLATVTVFDNVFLNMTDAGSGVSRVLDTLPYQLPRAFGSGRGLEIYVRRTLSKRLTGFISYTLSRSSRTFNGEHRPAGFDRTHVLATAVGYDFGRGWNAGLRFNLQTGTPFVGLGGRPFLDEHGDVQRDPLFTRFDFRVEKQWQLSSRSHLSVVLELVNAGFKQQTVHGSQLPPVVLPNFGFEAVL